MKLQTMPLRFRVWDKEEKELIYDAELAYDYLYPDHNPLCVHNFYELIQDDRYIISQDTGYKYSDGKSVFTGDIVRSKEWGNYWKIDYKLGIVTINNNSGDEYYTSIHMNDIEYVSTIWQNPELLEGATKDY